MTLPNESVGPNGIDFTTATCVSAWIEYPFNQNGDSDTKVYRHIMQVKRANYAPLEFNDEMTAADSKPERSPFPDDALAFWVGDTQPTQIGGDLVEFQRTFANVPASRSEGYGLYTFDRPGVVDASGTLTAIATSTTNITISNTRAEHIIEVTFEVSTSDIDKFTVGMSFDEVKNNSGDNLFYTNFRHSSSVVEYRSFRLERMIVTEISGNIVSAQQDDRIIYPDWYILSDDSIDVNGGLSTYDILNGVEGRQPKTINATAVVVSDYFKVDDIFLIQPILKFQVVNSAGDDTEYLSNTTTPTTAGYTTMMSTRTLLPLDDSPLERWMGNIWLRSTINTVAQ